ncbi:MAG: sigma-70 family RNA polymerase sigma factor [Acidimicrobiaceae bacterium]|nr:sigma-70 family RNA polymerase sigma factor [Acidimicrobiaceae bacterium]MDE0499426.1 sigma-70 family RNA polymerase sigma factor [Acidimicrobiaceae bacterium]
MVRGRRASADALAVAQRWMLSVAVGELRRRREDPHDPQTMPEQPLPGTEEPQMTLAEIDEAREALTRLDDLSRSIVVLRAAEELSYEQIAEALGISLAQVKVRLLRARRTLAAVTRRGEP